MLCMALNGWIVLSFIVIMVFILKLSVINDKIIFYFKFFMLILICCISKLYKKKGGVHFIEISNNFWCSGYHHVVTWRHHQNFKTEKSYKENHKHFKQKKYAILLLLYYCILLLLGIQIYYIFIFLEAAELAGLIRKIFLF